MGATFKIPFVNFEFSVDWRHVGVVVVTLLVKYLFLGYVVRISGMGDPMFLPFIGITLLIIWNIGRWIMQSVNKDEKSEFFQESVMQTYTAKQNEDAILLYNRMKEKFMDQVAEKIKSGPDLPVDWCKHLNEKELIVLKTALRKRMYRNIDCLAALERDKPGKYKLWRHKLVSEEVWESLQRVEDSVTKEIDECVLEADEIAPGWGQDLFQEVLEMWRAEQQKEMEQQKIQERVSREREAKSASKQEATRQAQMSEKEVRQREIDAEKLAAELAREEEIQAAKDAKKNKNGQGKKKGKK